MSIKSMTKTLRFVLIGDSNTGKTTFFNKINYIMNKVVSESIGLDLLTYKDKDGNKVIIWDTCGDKKYRQIVGSYLRNNCGILLFLDLKRNETLNGIESWLETIEQNNVCCHNHPIFLIGIKSDDNEEIDHLKLGDLVDKYKLIFIASCLEDLDAISIMDIIISEVLYRFGNKPCLGIKHSEEKTIKLIDFYDKNTNRCY